MAAHHSWRNRTSIAVSISSAPARWSTARCSWRTWNKFTSPRGGVSIPFPLAREGGELRGYASDASGEEQCMAYGRLLLWMESQPALIIALITFGACYLCAAVIFVIARVLVSKRIANELKATTPVMLTPLAVLTGLVIAFVASRIWTNFDHAHAIVRDEARSLQQTLTLAQKLPQNVQTEIGHAVADYLQFTHEEEWPAMLGGRAQMRTSVPGLTDAMSAILSFAPENPGQQLAQQGALTAIEQALDARRHRILLSGASVLPMQWVVILVLGTLMLATVAMVHIDRPLAMAVNLFILSTALAVCLLLLLVNDRPFSTGGYEIRPDSLGQIVID